MKKIRVRAPRGFYFKIRTEVYKKKVQHVYVELFDRSRKERYSYPIGEVELEKAGPKSFATHSSLRHEYWGKKLGVLMYSKAIDWGMNHGFKVRSSGSSSDMAKRVWNSKSLREIFDVKKVTRRPTYGGSYETWYAYPKSRKKRKK